VVIKWRTLIFVLLFFLICIKNSFSDVDDREYIMEETEFINTVQSSTKYTKSVLESAATISLVQPLELRFFYYPDLKTLLNFSPGLYVIDNGTYWSLGNRGIQIPGSINSRSLFLFDGYQINNYFSGYPLNIPSNYVHALEIVHGYSNVYFGSNSLLATINIIPSFRYYKDDYYKDTVFKTYSYFNFYDNKVNNNNGFMINKKIGNYYFTLSGDFVNYKGREIFFPEKKIINDFTLPNFGFVIDDRLFYSDRSYSSNFALYLYNEAEKFGYIDYQSRYHFPYYGYFYLINSPYSFGNDRNRFIFYERKFNLSPNSKIITKLSYYSYGIHKEAIYEPNFSNIILRYWGMAVDLLKNNIFSVENNFYYKFKKGELLMGLEWKRSSFSFNTYESLYSDLNPFDRNIVIEFVNGKRYFNLFSLYFHLDYYLKDDLILALGARYDDYSNMYKNFSQITSTGYIFQIKNVYAKPSVIPNIGIIKKIKDDKAIKLIYSQNIRFPFFNEVIENGTWSYYLAPNEDVSVFPERHRTLELIYYSEYKKRNVNSYFTFSVFSTKITNLINEYSALADTTGDASYDESVLVFKSYGNLESTGAFLDYVYQFSYRKFIRFSASYSNVRVTKGIPGIFEYLPNSPKLLLLAKYGQNITNNLSVAFELKYTSDVLVDDYRRLINSDGWAWLVSQGVFPEPEKKIKSYWLANLTLRYYIDQNKYFTLYVNNLFNTKYDYPLSIDLSRPMTRYPGYKRSIFLGLNWSF